jgi:hypothetical protein
MKGTGHLRRPKRLLFIDLRLTFGTSGVEFAICEAAGEVIGREAIVLPIGNGKVGNSATEAAGFLGGNDIGSNPGGLFGGTPRTLQISVSSFRKNVPFSVPYDPSGDACSEAI